MKKNSTWQMTDARRHFSAVIDNALTRGPQTILRHGEPAVLVVSVAELAQMRRRKKSVFELFAMSNDVGRREMRSE
jgi:prevent-host-death family protein